jgi:SAM-dependent methyltransferase
LQATKYHRLPPLSVHAWLRYSAVLRLMRDLDGRSALEIGFGQGGMGARLATRYDYVGVELDELAATKARSRFVQSGLDPARLLGGGLEQLEGRTFDLVCAFEVIEHVESDGHVLAEWREFVAPGGAIILSAPASPERFGPADEKAGHFRRYSRDDMRRLLSETGFSQIRILNYGFPAGYALEVARNLLAKRELRKTRDQQERTLASGRWLQPPDWAAPVTRVISEPLRLVQHPFMEQDRGTGLVAAALRRD